MSVLIKFNDTNDENVRDKLGLDSTKEVDISLQLHQILSWKL